MGDAVVASTARTAIGTAFKGSLLDVDAFELGTKAVAEAVRRSGVDSALVEGVFILGPAVVALCVAAAHPEAASAEGFAPPMP